MKVTCLVDDISKTDLKAVHGLSFFIETKDRVILFDVGPSFSILAENATKAGVDLARVDTVVISHGHEDHGGAISQFVARYPNVKVYVGRGAFEPHISTTSGQEKNIGIPSFDGNVTEVGGMTSLDDNMVLFVSRFEAIFTPDNSKYLTAEGYPDDFLHEISLLIKEGEKRILFCGCAHRGIEGIIKTVQFLYGEPTAVVGGFHLLSQREKNVANDKLISALGGRLNAIDTHYYTCHCTGEEGFRKLKERLANKIEYMGCGKKISF